MDMSTNDIIPIENQTYDRSNALISSKYNASLLENQVMAIAQTRIQMNKRNSEMVLEAKLYPGELKKLISDEAHIYRDLKKLSKSIIGHTMFLEDGNGNFKAFSVVPNATYVDGVFTIEFNKEVRDHLLGLKENRVPHTSLAIPIMTSFGRNSSFRIYELLKKDLFRINQRGNEGKVVVEYNLFEFRFMIGIANVDNVHVKKYTDSVKEIDWEYAYKILEEKGGKNDIKFKATDKLQNDCIKLAQEELAEKSDLRFDYELIYVGRKYGKIRFTIYKNEPKEPSELLERQQYMKKMSEKDRQMEFPMDIYKPFYDEYVGHNKLSKEDIDLLLFKTSGDQRIVEKAIQMADEASKKTVIQNYMGWIISCIEEQWYEQPVSNGSAEEGEIVMTAHKEYGKADKDSVAKQSWEKIKKLEGFKPFMEAVLKGGLDIEQLEIIYTYQELVKAYTDYKSGYGINL